MSVMCEHQLELENSWLSGPRIICRTCGKRWDVRGKMLADFFCWMADILILAFSPVFFGNALRAFAAYGQAGKFSGIVIFGLVISPFMIAVHMGVFAMGHAVHAWWIRRAGDLRRWIVQDPYHE